MTKKRIQFLRMIYQFDLSRKSMYNYKGASASEISKFMKGKGFVLTDSSVGTYFKDLSLLDFVSHEEGVSGTWRITKVGENYLQGLDSSKEMK